MTKRKLFFFGIDSATWDLIKPWAKAGKLPGFAKLLKQGATSDLGSTVPPLTPVAWPTAMTGASPAQHGFYDFYRLDKTKQLTVNLASDLPHPFFWEQLSQEGKKMAIFNLPITYPFQPINGIFISGLMTPGKEAEFIAPAELKTEFLKRFPKFHFATTVKVSKQDPDSYQEKLQEIIQDAKETVRVAKWLLTKDHWDLFMINFMAVDHVQHFFWEFMSQKNSPYQDAILRIYQIVDQYLLEVLQNQGKDYQIMVFSDHGAGSLEQTIFLNHYLAQKGYLHFKNTPLVSFKRVLAGIGFNPEALTRWAGKLGLVRHAGRIEMAKRNRLMNKLILSYADLDWQKTQAYSFGMYGGIFLTRKNPTLARKIMNEIKQDFKDKLSFIELSQNIYRTNKLPKTIPDIQFLFKEGAVVSTNIYAFSGNKLLTAPITNKSGEHRMTGILGFYPKVNLSKDATLLAITPTILDFFQSPAPAYCKGRSLLTNQAIDNLEVQDVVV